MSKHPRSHVKPRKNVKRGSGKPFHPPKPKTTKKVPGSR